MDELCDIRLLYKDEDKQQYACGACSNLAIDAKALVCDEKYHEQDTRFYCGSCAKSIQSADKCPNTQHSNPVFSDQKVTQAKIQRSECICLYSAQLNLRAAIAHNAVDDTMEGKAQHHGTCCRWKGSYQQLKYHVLNCRFKPRENKSVEALQNKVQYLEANITELHREMKEMKAIFQQLKQSVDGNRAEATEQLRDLRQSLDVNRNEISQKVNRDEMNGNIAQEVVLSDYSLIWRFSAVIAVICVVWMYYEQHNEFIKKSDVYTYINNNYSDALNDINWTTNTLNIKLNDLYDSHASLKNEWNVMKNVSLNTSLVEQDNMSSVMQVFNEEMNIKLHNLYAKLKNECTNMMENINENWEVVFEEIQMKLRTLDSVAVDQSCNKGKNNAQLISTEEEDTTSHDYCDVESDNIAFENIAFMNRTCYKEQELENHQPLYWGFFHNDALRFVVVACFSTVCWLCILALRPKPKALSTGKRKKTQY